MFVTAEEGSAMEHMVDATSNPAHRMTQYTAVVECSLRDDRLNGWTMGYGLAPR